MNHWFLRRGKRSYCITDIIRRYTFSFALLNDSVESTYFEIECIVLTITPWIIHAINLQISIDMQAIWKANRRIINSLCTILLHNSTALTELWSTARRIYRWSTIIDLIIIDKVQIQNSRSIRQRQINQRNFSSSAAAAAAAAANDEVVMGNTAARAISLEIDGRTSITEASRPTINSSATAGLSQIWQLPYTNERYIYAYILPRRVYIHANKWLTLVACFQPDNNSVKKKNWLEVAFRPTFEIKARH